MGYVLPSQGWQPVVVFRHEPVHPKTAAPMGTGLSAPAPVEESPQPVADSTFAGVGRDSAHAPTPIRTFRGNVDFTTLTHMGWPFLPGMKAAPSSLVFGNPPGRQNPIRERVPVTMPQQTSLGSMTAVAAPVMSTPALAKLTF